MSKPDAKQTQTDNRDEPQLQRSASHTPDWPTRFRQLAAKTRDPRLKRYYESGAPAADTPISQAPLLAIDFETTGLDARRDGIVSIGLVPMSLSRILCSKSRHWVLKPRARLNSESVVIHGITNSDVEQAPDLLEILHDLLELMAGHIMVVHYRGIERGFLNAALKDRIGEGIDFPVIDTMELEARLHRRPLPWWKRLWPTKRVSIRLADSRSRYNLPFYRPHHALTDALASAELLQAQVADRYSPETPVSKLWK